MHILIFPNNSSIFHNICNPFMKVGHIRESTAPVALLIAPIRSLHCITGYPIQTLGQKCAQSVFVKGSSIIESADISISDHGFYAYVVPRAHVNVEWVPFIVEYSLVENNFLKKVKAKCQWKI